MRSLFAPRPSPYYIFGFDYRRSSAGIRVMHMLCDALIRSGYEAYVLAEVFSPDLMTPRLTDQVIQHHRDLGVRPIAVYPEVIDGNPLQGSVVVRYLLNKPGFIGGSGAYGENDLYFAYKSDFMLEGMSPEQHLFLPAIDSNIFRPADDPARRCPGSVCYYLGHKRHARLDPSLLPADAIEITLNYPDSWEGLADIFQRCEYLYLGEASGLAYEAALCGCTPVLVSRDWSSVHPDPQSFTAFGLEADEIERARSRMPGIRQLLEEHRAAFWPELDRFIAQTQDAVARLPSATDHVAPRVVQALAPGSDAQGQPTAVVLHVGDLPLFEEGLRQLQGLHAPIRLYVSAAAGQIHAVRQALEASGLAFRLFQVDGIGQDVLPFIELLPTLREDGMQVLLKLHTHKARYLKSDVAGELIRQLFSTLLFENTFDSAVASLTRGDKEPLIGADEYRLPVGQSLEGERREQVERLAERGSVDIKRIASGEYFAGNMFFARVEALADLLELGLGAEDFGTAGSSQGAGFAHAFELFVNAFLQLRHPIDRNVLYREWLATRQLSANETRNLPERVAQWPATPSLLVVLEDPSGDVAGVARSLAALDAQSYAAGAVVVLSNAEPVGIEARENLVWLPRDAVPAQQINALLEQIEVDWFLLLRSGDTLEEHALLLLAERLVSQPALRCCYMDEDQHYEGVNRDPVFKPDLNLDMLRSYPYVGRALAFERQSVLELGGLDTAFGELAPHDVLFRLIEVAGLESIGHLDTLLLHTPEHLGGWLASPAVVAQVAPLVDAHLTRLNLPHRIEPGALPMINRVHYSFDTRPLVSIIIPTKDQLPTLLRCVDSLLERTRYAHYEVLIVDNNSETPEALAWFEGIEKLGDARLRVLRYPHPFNYSAINNFAARQARGEYLVLLNNDTGITDGHWLDALLNHAQRPEVGVVGAKLHFLDGSVQHAGVVMGLRGVAEHAFIGDAIDGNGYMHRLQVDQNYSVVTAACLMVRASLYHEVNGLDESDFAVSFNDVDFCLKVGRAGYLVVWTPYAVLMHEGSVSQRKVDLATFEAKVQRFRSEQQAMYQRWLPQMVHDAAYNRNLALEGRGFALDHRGDTGWQPFAERRLPFVLCHPADAFGCGHYRIRQPLAACIATGSIDGAVAERLLPLVEFERLAPTSVVLQRQITPPQLQAIELLDRCSEVFKVYEVDDYLFELPVKSAHHASMPKDIARSMTTALGYCDRFVVSTEPLAEAFAGLHPDIRVVPNRLPGHWWSNLRGERNAGCKPRVGWAGGSSHGGDLELIIEVVKTLASEVEWVFMGMCPEPLKPFVEFHPGVSIDRYPAALAALNLDLALAPLEPNRFNECKSNLRLLEYGALGYPVICSDILCYRDGLPVTRLPNQARVWVSAIREQLADPQALARAGDTLREAVLRDWMLDEVHAQRWAAVWLPD